MQQVIITAPVSNRKQDDQVPEIRQSQEIRDGTPEWKSVVKVVLIVALIAAIVYASKIIIPKVLTMVQQAANTTSAVVEGTTTVLNAVETTVTNTAEGVATAINSVGTAAKSIGDSTALAINSVAVAYDKVATSVSKTFEFIGDALTRPLPVVLVETIAEHIPVNVQINTAEPWRFTRFVNFIKMFK